MKYKQYEALAEFYDRLNPDVDYVSWAAFIKKIIEKYGRENTFLVLDLACGTGSMSVELSKLGFDVIGVDLSAEMLMEAQQKAYGEGQHILFLNQNMCELDLYGTVDAAVCCLDSLNYLTDEKDIKKTLSLVNNFMNDGGLFIFDVNTPHKFRKIYGNNAYIIEDEGVLCAWQNTFDEKEGICDFDLSFFVEKRNGSYDRFDESQREKMYTDETLRRLLDETSFEVIGVYSDYSFTPYTDTDERWYYVCRANNKNK
ncbi:MAG: class I SAM-dependent methyltransferase [Clostridia bacterium]|nr:class I SAM-dependent methyltransferase [Clostridia bacterium]